MRYDGSFPLPVGAKRPPQPPGNKEKRMVFPLGSLINGLAIAAGGPAGLLPGARLPERIRLILFQGLVHRNI